jgi:hypothetical protein
MEMHSPPMFMKPSFVPQGGSSQGYQLGKNPLYIEFDFFFFIYQIKFWWPSQTNL